jgi:ribonuclease HII
VPDFHLERSFWNAGARAVVGVDEAGRGCLAGPVVAAAVVFPSGIDLLPLAVIDDSKRLSKKRREDAVAVVRSNALAVGIASCSPAEIDRLNILWAAMEAMRRAVQECAAASGSAPDHVLVDGNREVPGAAWPQTTVVKGDAKSLSIAAASIIAKTHRDALMRALHEDHPHYGWDRNAGYPTKAHYEGLEAHGQTPHHRTTFRLKRR